jgi:nucleoside-diphosphate-sugar epimerase
VRALVTGVAGFIGSALAGALVEDGHDVVGIDAFSDSYERWRKEGNLRPLIGRPDFRLIEGDLVTTDLSTLVGSVDVVFHLAAHAGVRPSWGERFGRYVQQNVVATQCLLDACRHARRPPRVVFASSSSVYGDPEAGPSTEDDELRPRNPYGVTKVAGEHLFRVYAESWDVPSVLLRLFTVYGPGQRPDMATFRLCEAALGGPPFRLYGDGSHRREFTYVGDVVRAFRLAATADLEPATALNVAGGSSVAMADLIERVGVAAGTEVPVERLAAKPGDVAVTAADTSRTTTMLGWTAVVGIDEGLQAQMAWHRQVRARV